MSELDASIARGLDEVRARIAIAAARAGRRPDDVTLVAVSKTKPVEAIRAAYALGQRIFGENYVQELEEKRHALRDLPDLELHFIGHLQRNKVKVAVDCADVVATVDSERLLLEVAKRAPRPTRILLQVNVAREPQKGGCDPEELPALVTLARQHPTLLVDGLMTIPPAGSAEEARPFFRALRALRDAHGLRVLSMGMSEDLEVAIEEGATHVRVGSAIFGAR